MKQLFTIVLLSIGLLTYSQDWDFEKPNYKKIEKNIQEKGSNPRSPKFATSEPTKVNKFSETFTPSPDGIPEHIYQALRSL